jgi:hypothetical protein
VESGACLQVSRVAACFVDLLRRRLVSGTFTTEDSIRFTFFAAVLQSEVRPERVVLECPHPAIRRAKVDTVILGEDGEPNAAVEFKYDRANPGGTNQPKPQKAGAVVADLARLLLWPEPVQRYLVYVTDREMFDYWTEPANGLERIIALPAGSGLQICGLFFERRPKVFREAMGEWPEPALLDAVVNSAMPNGHHLRVWQVQPVSANKGE